MPLVNGGGGSPGQPTPGVVEQDKSSRGSVDTTKTRSGPQRVIMSSGERPMGAAKGKQTNTMALCQPTAHPLKLPRPPPHFRRRWFGWCPWAPPCARRLGCVLLLQVGAVEGRGMHGEGRAPPRRAGSPTPGA